jgi:hypothetical protein
MNLRIKTIPTHPIHRNRIPMRMNLLIPQVPLLDVTLTMGPDGMMVVAQPDPAHWGLLNCLEVVPSHSVPGLIYRLGMVAQLSQIPMDGLVRVRMGVS